MKLLTFASLSVLIAISQAAAVSWLSAVPVFLSLYKPAEGFFGIFRRRQPKEPPVITESPQNPFMSGFPSQGGQNFFNPFGGSGSGGFFPGSQRPNFPGGFSGFPGGFQGFMPWGQNPSIPQFPPQGQFAQIPPRGQLPPMSSLPQQTHQSQSSQINNFESKEQGLSSTENFDSNEDFSQDQNFDNENFDENGDFGGNQQFDSNQNFDGENNFDESPPAINTEEAESFFTLLSETDENKCISRLVCEMGADPDNAGDLGRTVNDIVGSLTNFPPGSKVSEYNEILRKGRAKGLSTCVADYSECDQETYTLMKSNQPDE